MLISSKQPPRVAIVPDMETAYGDDVRWYKCMYLNAVVVLSSGWFNCEERITQSICAPGIHLHFLPFKRLVYSRRGTTVRGIWFGCRLLVHTLRGIKIDEGVHVQATALWTVFTHAMPNGTQTHLT